MLGASMHLRARLALLALSFSTACNEGEESTEETLATTTSTTTGTSTADASTAGTASGSTSDTPTSTDATTSSPATTDATDAATSVGPGSSTGPAPGSCEGDAPRVRLATTLGDLVVQLDAVNAPITVANFVHYVEAGFYSDTIFHRVIDGFVVQGGGYGVDLQMKPTDAPIPLEIGPGLLHVDGAIGMARTMEPNSATSQFYLCDGPQPGLDGSYAVFGVLVEGSDVLDAISAVATDPSDTPIEPVILLSATCE